MIKHYLNNKADISDMLSKIERGIPVDSKAKVKSYPEGTIRSRSTHASSTSGIPRWRDSFSSSRSSTGPSEMRVTSSAFPTQ